MMSFRQLVCSSLLAFMVAILFIISEWVPLPNRILCFWWIEFKVSGQVIHFASGGVTPVKITNDLEEISINSYLFWSNDETNWTREETAALSHAPLSLTAAIYLTLIGDLGSMLSTLLTRNKILETWSQIENHGWLQLHFNQYDDSKCLLVILALFS